MHFIYFTIGRRACSWARWWVYIG